MRLVVKVANINCTMCAAAIHNHFNNQEGIKAQVLVTDKKVIFEYDKRYTENQIYQELKSIGFDPIITNADEKKEKLKDRIDFWVATIFTLPLLWTMFEHLGIPLFVPDILMDGWVQLALTIPVQFFVGRRFFKAAYKQIKSKSLGMDVLIVIGTMAAFIYSLYVTISDHFQPMNLHHLPLYFEVSAVIIYMVLIGNIFETKVKKRASDELASLMNLGVKEARLLTDNGETMIPIDQLKLGDKVVVLANEKVPIDGLIIEGSTYIDNSVLTGESIPLYKTNGDPLFGTSMNLSDKIIISVSAVGSDTVLAQIIKTVEDAATFKPKAQRIADKISAYFVPIVIVLGIITFILQTIITQDLEFAFRCAVAVVAISCPCALGLATPTSVSVAGGIAFKSGFLYKGGEFFETAYKVKGVAFDKTGTLTIGKPQVIDFSGDMDTLIYTRSLELHSNHPLALAIKEYQITEELAVSNYEVIAGLGVKGIIEGKEVIVGSSKIIADFNETNTYYELFNKYSKEGKTVIFTLIDQKVVNMISIIDPLKEDAKTLIDNLKARKIVPYMITGDQKDTAKYIANQVGIDHVYAEVLPHEKAQVIQKIREQQSVVAFVGDGINDAPALTVADIGFVVSTGSDIALDNADIALMKNDLDLVIVAMNLSKATNINIYLNFFWAFIYNIVMIPVAALGFITPQLAGIGMAFSSIMVVLNALSLRLYKINQKKEVKK